MILVIIIAMVYFNKDKIVEKAIDELETKTNSEIEYTSTNIGIDNTFPNLLVSANDLRIKGKGDSLELIQFEKISVALNPISILKNQEELRIRRLTISNPVIHLIEKRNGNKNWDFYQTESDGSNNSNSKYIIDEIKIEEGELSYSNLNDNSTYQIIDLDYVGNIELNDDVLSQNHSASAHFSSSGTPYDVKDYSLQFNGDTKTNLDNQKVDFHDAVVEVEKLKFDLNGNVEPAGNGYKYLIDLESQDQNFENLLSIVQALKETETKDLNASGDYHIKGRIEGLLNDQNEYPLYSLSIDTENAKFNLPDDNRNQMTVDISGSVRNTDANKSFSILELDKFDIKRDHEQVSGSADIRQVNDDITVKYDINAKVDNINNFNSLTEYELIGGKIELLSHGDFDLSQLESRDLSDIDFDIDWTSENIEILLDSTKLTSSLSEGRGDQKRITINLGDTKYGQSDIKGDISIKKPLAYFKSDPNLNMDINLQSTSIDLNEILKPNVETSSSRNDLVSQISANIELQSTNVQYLALPIENMKFKGIVKNDAITIDNSSFQIEKSDLALNGQLNNLSSYINNEGELIGTIDIASKRLDADRLEELYYDPIYTSSESSGGSAFDNLDIKIISSSDILNYNNTHLTDNLASLNLKDNALVINDVISNSFGGKLNIRGDVEFGQEKSKVALKTDFQNISIAQSLESIPLLKKISYPLTFINGRINTTLSLSSGIDSDYNFILSEIDAFALLETLDGKIIGFEPLEKLNSYLGVNDKADVVIKQSKNWITISEGWVKVEEFKFSFGDYHFKVKGAHSLENDLDYTIMAEVPAGKLSKINMEDIISPQLVNKLNKFRSVKKGHVGFLFEMTGAMNQPVLKLNEIDIISAGKEAIKQTVQEVKDSVRNKLDTIRYQVEEQVRDTIDVLVEKGEEQMETVIDSVKEIAKEEIKSKVDSTLLNQLDSLGGGILKDQVPIDSIKDQIFKLKDIFKRKNSE